MNNKTNSITDVSILKKTIILIALCTVSFNAVSESKEEQCQTKAKTYQLGMVDPASATKMINTIDGYGSSVTTISGVPKEAIRFGLVTGIQLNKAGTTREEAKTMAQTLFDKCMSK